ncbi:MAG: galactokinase, partial [Thermoguttaceae bacterium]
PSLYLYRADLFYKVVGRLDNRNAQGEYYITDTVRLLGCQRERGGDRSYRVRAVSLDKPDCIQGFNSPDELLVIQDYVRRSKSEAQPEGRVSVQPRLTSSQYATVGEWLGRVDPSRRDARRWFRDIYGAHDDLHAEKCRDLVKVLNCYGKQFGFDEKVCIVRAPGRINLMGRHVDHRGGWTNFLAIDRETIAVAGLRDDDTVQAVSAEPRRFSPVSFRVSELMGRFAWSDWVNFVNSEWVRDLIYREAGHWGNYLKAAMLRLQHAYHDVMVRGMNVAVIGNVPVAAGLSSSSTLVVATLQAAIALNNFDLTSRQFIDMCGEGEWFVGSRGGAGDHAAIYLGQRGKIAHVGYLPFQLHDVFDAPRDYQVLVANSHIQAAKSSGARDQFNSRIAAYNLGLAVLKQRAPEYGPAIEHLRDVTPATLGCASSDIYRLLLRVPQIMTRQDFREILSREHQALIENSFATHADPGRYHPRGVLLFGIAEILRARRCVELLKEGEVEAFGRLMRVSHDGDRVSIRDQEGQIRALPDPCTDDYLRRLIDDLKSEDPRWVERAQLDRQAGYYACSTEEIDGMIDSLADVPGVAGAQIAGAGLGGCIMILARKDAVAEVRRTLDRGYYRPAELKPDVIPCIAVEGAGLVEFA